MSEYFVSEEEYRKAFEKRKEREQRLLPEIIKMKTKEGDYILWGEGVPVRQVKEAGQLKEIPHYSGEDIKFIFEELKIQKEAFYSFKRGKNEVWDYYKNGLGGEVSKDLVLIVEKQWDEKEQKWRKARLRLVNQKGITNQIERIKAKGS